MLSGNSVEGWTIPVTVTEGNSYASMLECSLSKQKYRVVQDRVGEAEALSHKTSKATQMTQWIKWEKFLYQNTNDWKLSEIPA